MNENREWLENTLVRLDEYEKAREEAEIAAIRLMAEWERCDGTPEAIRELLIALQEEFNARQRFEALRVA